MVEILSKKSEYDSRDYAYPSVIFHCCPEFVEISLLKVPTSLRCPENFLLSVFKVFLQIILVSSLVTAPPARVSRPDACYLSIERFTQLDSRLAAKT